MARWSTRRLSGSAARALSMAASMPPPAYFRGSHHPNASVLNAATRSSSWCSTTAAYPYSGKRRLPGSGRDAGTSVRRWPTGRTAATGSRSASTSAGRSLASSASARLPGRCINVVPSGSGIVLVSSSLTRRPPDRPAGRNPPRTSSSPSGRATTGRIPRFSPSAPRVNPGASPGAHPPRLRMTSGARRSVEELPSNAPVRKEGECGP